jgi:reverse gyrase
MADKQKTKTRKHSLISEHYDGVIEKMKQRRVGVPDYYYQLNEDQKAQNEYIMQNMNKKTNYLKNPRYLVNNAPIFYADVVIFDPGHLF